jgi:spore photoproduct lyase
VSLSAPAPSLPGLTSGANPAAVASASRLLAIDTIYHEPAALDHLRGREIFDRFPDACRIEVASHWGLHGNEGLAEQWMRVKRTVLVLGVKKSFAVRPNGRSADFIAPGLANGCAMACVYCYVPRRKGFANPITAFVNIEAMCRAVSRHAQAQGPKTEPNQVDPDLWVYDIGENSDCSVDAAISDNVRDLVELFHRLPNAKASFATKHVNRTLLDYDPRGKTRIRFSLMPAHIAKLADVRTSPMAERIAAINDFVEAGYEVHVNFSPVIVYEGWSADYAALFEELDAALSPAAKAQLKSEVIFLTHNEALHEINLRWHPKGEELLWQPRWQEAKTSQTGGANVRYRHGMKGKLVARFRELLAARLPYCAVRYAF